MKLRFCVAGHFDKHTRTGGWALSYTEQLDATISTVKSGGLELGYSKFYCDAYPVLRSLYIAHDLFYLPQYIDEEECHVEICTLVEFVQRRIDKEWSNKDRIKNFVRKVPWDLIREQIIGLTSLDGIFYDGDPNPITHAGAQLALLKDFAWQACNRLRNNSVTENDG